MEDEKKFLDGIKIEWKIFSREWKENEKNAEWKMKKTSSNSFHPIPCLRLLFSRIIILQSRIVISHILVVTSRK